MSREFSLQNIILSWWLQSTWLFWAILQQYYMHNNCRNVGILLKILVTVFVPHSLSLFWYTFFGNSQYVFKLRTICQEILLLFPDTNIKNIYFVHNCCWNIQKFSRGYIYLPNEFPEGNSISSCSVQHLFQQSICMERGSTWNIILRGYRSRFKSFGHWSSNPLTPC